jgi:hypothetical protein
VRTIELLELHFVAGVFEVGDQAPAVSVNRQDLVRCAMENKDARSAGFLDAGRDESGRKCPDFLQAISEWRHSIGTKPSKSVLGLSFEWRVRSGSRMRSLAAPYPNSAMTTKLRRQIDFYAGTERHPTFVWLRTSVSLFPLIQRLVCDFKEMNGLFW